MRMCLFALGVVVVSLFNNAGSVTASGKETELQGAWIVVHYEENGSADNEIIGAKFIIKGDKYSFKTTDRERRGGLQIDPMQKPKQIDFLYLVKDDGGVAGIYVLEGDTLKICLNREETAERPTAFATQKGTALSLTVLKREKAGGKENELQGTWMVLSHEGSGSIVVGAKVIIDGDKFTVTNKDRQESMRFQLNATQKPKQIDFFRPRDERKDTVGIYILEGETLTICWNNKDQGRPTEFSTKNGGFDRRLMVLKREKK